MKNTPKPGVWPVDPFEDSGRAVSPTARDTWPVQPFGDTPVAPVFDHASPRRPRRLDLSFLARGSVLNLVGALTSAVLSFAVVIVASRGLDPSRAGVFFEGIALFLILSNAAELGADSGLLRFIPRYRTLRRTRELRELIAWALWPVCAAAAAMAVATYVAAPQLARLFFHTTHQQQAIRTIHMVAVFFPAAALTSVVLAGTRGFGAMIPAVVLDNVGTSVLRVAGAGAALALGAGVVGIMIGYGFPSVLAFAIATAWLYRLVRKAEHRDPGLDAESRSRRHFTGDFWRFAAPRGLVGGLNTTQVWLDTLLVGGLVGTGQAAVYTVATRYVIVGSFAIQAVQVVISPQISNVLSLGDRPRATTLYKTATEWLMVASWPVYFVLPIFAHLLLRVFGAHYGQGQVALVILSLTMLGFVATGPVVSVLVMGGKSVWSMANAIVSLALNIGLNLVLIPHLGIEGAALAWMASIAVGQLAALIEVQVLLKLSPFSVRSLVVAMACAAIFGGLGLLVRAALGETVPSFLAYLVVSTALYLAFLWAFRRQLNLDVLRRAVSSQRRHRSMLDPA